MCSVMILETRNYASYFSLLTAHMCNLTKQTPYRFVWLWLLVIVGVMQE